VHGGDAAHLVRTNAGPPSEETKSARPGVTEIKNMAAVANLPV